MKHFFKGIFVLLSFLIVSCTKLPPQTIQGTWQNERTVRTDLLSNPEDENSVFARFDTRQKIVYEFLPDGTFVKTISESFVKVIPVKEEIQIDDDLILKLKSTGGEFSVLGTFKVDRQKIHLFPQFVNLNGIENIAFSYALEQNPAIKKERADLNYTLHPATLYLQSEDGTLDAFSAQEN